MISILPAPVTIFESVPSPALSQISDESSQISATKVIFKTTGNIPEEGVSFTISLIVATIDDMRGKQIDDAKMHAALTIQNENGLPIYLRISANTADKSAIPHIFKISKAQIPKTLFIEEIRVPAFSIIIMNTIITPATEISIDCSSLPDLESIWHTTAIRIPVPAILRIKDVSILYQQ